NVYITHEKGSKSVNYLSNGDTVSTGGQTYHKYYRDWIIVIDDAKSHSDDKPSISIKYQTIVYTWNDLTDLYNANIDTNRITGDVQKQEYYNKYTPFLVQSNEDNGSMGALFYNFSSFNRDMMENYLISDATDLNLYSNSAFKNLSSVSVSADIISLDLGTSLIAGLAGFIQNDQSLAQSYNNTQVDSTSSVDSEGNEITSISQNFSLRNSESNIDTVAIGTAMSEVKDFAKVLQQLFVSGTVVTPGLGRIITILSLINIYVYISNRLDTVSGKYRVLSQVDEINGGKYTTTLSIMKALTLNGDTVYDVISSGNSNSEVVESTLSEYSAGDTTTSLFTNGVQKSMTKCYISLGVQGKVPKRQMLTRYTTDSKRKKFVADWAYIYVPKNLSGNVVFSAEMPDADTNGCKEVTLDWQCWYRSNLIAYNENLLQHLDTLDDVVQWSPLSGWKQQWDASGKSAVAKDIQRPLSLDAQGKTTGDYMYIIKFTTPLNFAGDYSSDGGYYVYAVFPVKLTMLSN
ncbi:MAG: hypothetical protein IKH10_01595, partial [Bacteroidetes bacterium]|nr:hypothetical protein [Bacteroidota bacterium]